MSFYSVKRPLNDFVTDGPTDRQTNQRTNGPTKKWTGEPTDRLMNQPKMTFIGL